jgi:hypothetical protein
MKASNLEEILADLWTERDIENYNVIGPNGRPISGVQIDHEKKEVILKQRNAWVENLGISFVPGAAPAGLTERDLKRVDL